MYKDDQLEVDEYRDRLERMIAAIAPSIRKDIGETPKDFGRRLVSAANGVLLAIDEAIELKKAEEEAH